MPNMNLEILIVVSIFFQVNGQIDSNENDEMIQRTLVEIEIAELELQDDFEVLAQTRHTSLIENKYTLEMKARQNRGNLIKKVAQNLRRFQDVDIPFELQHKLTVFIKPGDGLLSQKDWKELISFDIGISEILHSAQVHCNSNGTSCVNVKKGYDKLLTTSGNQTVLAKSWTAWQSLVSMKSKDFPKILRLTKTAARLNERNSVSQYWEMLLEKDDLYTSIDIIWEEIKPLYRKLYDFVQKRLSQKYNFTDNVPVFLLGSNYGDDWSNLAPLLLPNLELFSQFGHMTVNDMFKEAENFTKLLKIGDLGPEFWANSQFNWTFCQNQIVTFPLSEYSEVLTCNESSWTKYLDAFETSFKVALQNLDHLNLAQRELRVPVMDEVLSNLGTMLIIQNHFQKDFQKIEKLLLVALRMLPKLPFYLAADKWRLHLLENDFQDYPKSWWDFRKEYQGVEGVTNSESDFLGDHFMRNNQPYLGKFLGILIQFQFLEYYQPNWENPNGTVVTTIRSDETFQQFLSEISTTEWPLLIQNYYNFDPLSTSAILNYFEPLMAYFDLDPPIETTSVTSTTTKSPPVVVPNKTQEFDNTHQSVGPVHENIEEHIEGPNNVMDKLAFQIGVGLLICVAAVVVYAVALKKMKEGLVRTNNRMFGE